MRASVVVLNHNDREHIERCLGCLAAQRFDDFEVVVIDNASTDGSRELLREASGKDPRFRLVESDRNLGCAGGRNLGIARSAGDVVAFVDADAFPAQDWLQNVVRAFDGPGVGLVASRQLLDRNPWLLNGLGGTLNLQGYGRDRGFGLPDGLCAPPEAPIFASGNGLAVRGEVVARIGGFDETYVNYYEDVDLCLRARRAGVRLALAPGAVLRHALGAVSRPGARRSDLVERNRIRTVLRHYPPRLLLRWLYHEAGHERRARKLLPGGTFRRAWAWNVRHLPSVLAFRWRARKALAPFDAGLCVPSWGLLPSDEHNLAFRPDPAAWRDRVTFGENDLPHLLYGWYPDEPAPNGARFRWSDGLAGIGFRLSAPARRFTLLYSWPDELPRAQGAGSTSSAQRATAPLPPSSLTRPRASGFRSKPRPTSRPALPSSSSSRGRPSARRARRRGSSGRRSPRRRSLHDLDCPSGFFSFFEPRRPLQSAMTA